IYCTPQRERKFVRCFGMPFALSLGAMTHQILRIGAAVLSFFIWGCAHAPISSLTHQKERTAEPTTGRGFTVEQLAHHTPEFTPGLSREKWSNDERAALAEEEARAVIVEGYIDSVARQEDGDIHLWI